MFGFMKKKAAPELAAPIDGQIVAIENVSDPLFAQKAMGEGFGVKPIGDTVFAPVAGTVTSVFKTKHAIGITTADELEVLIHIGLDTVNLKGAPFTMVIDQGDTVAVGTPLVRVDFDQINAAKLDPIVLTLVTNSPDKLAAVQYSSGTAQHGDAVATLTLK